jgi:hypothetical protein
LVVGLSGWVRRGLVRWAAGGLLVGVLFASGSVADAQVRTTAKQKRPRHETNASRQARIERTIEQTYAHPWEVFGGGGFLRWESGQYTQKNNEVSWVAGANYYLSRKLAVVGEAQGSFGHAKPLRFNTGIGPFPNPQINEYFFTGGANYRFYTKEKVALSVQGTGGMAWGIFSSGSPYSYYGPNIGLWQDGIRPAFKFSVNADYNVYPNLALRIAPTYVGSTFGGQVQNNLGLNVGVVYRFGKR